MTSATCVWQYHSSISSATCLDAGLAAALLGSDEWARPYWRVGEAGLPSLLSESLSTTGSAAEDPFPSATGAEEPRRFRTPFLDDANVGPFPGLEAGLVLKAPITRKQRLPSFFIPQHCPFEDGQRASACKPLGEKDTAMRPWIDSSDCPPCCRGGVASEGECDDAEVDAGILGVLLLLLSFPKRLGFGLCH